MIEGFVEVCPREALGPGARRTVEVGGRVVAVLEVEGVLYAFDDCCPHRGGPLSAGDLDGHVLHCPLHAWPFDVRTGGCTLYPDACVATFEVREADGRVFVSAQPRPPRAGRERR